MEQRSPYFPAGPEFVVSDEGGLLAAEDVEEEAGVGVRVIGVGVPEVVAQVEFGLEGGGAKAGGFDVGFEVDGFFGLQADDELVGGHGLEGREGGERGKDGEREWLG